MNTIETIVHISADLIVSATIERGQNADVVVSGDLSIDAVVSDSGISMSVCPVIYQIDGGNANTLIFGPVNGLLNGGTA